MTRIVTYNVNGLRAAITKGFTDWLAACNPDVICLQEIKATPDQIDVSPLEQLGYRHYWYPAQKKGYSGVAIFSKVEPTEVVYGCGIESYDNEGRVLRADFGDLSIMSIYMPSGSSGDERQAFKMQWLADFDKYIAQLKTQRPYLVLCGDYNICHRAIDIHNPVSNAKTSGFLPEERAWMEQFINTGFIDSFRHINPNPHQYTWWSYRAGSRGKNLGWRIDYNMVSENLKSKIKHALILPEAKHSDHCPCVVELDLKLENFKWS